jgi:UPF0755 protein
MPETYKVPRGMSRDALIRKMEKDQEDALNRIWSHRAPDNPLKSPFELVTLASIVEKETGKVDERPRVAEVFLNRLSKHMRLQSDPTIVYGLVGGKGTLGRGILKSEVEQPTPYNTYVIDGLPPGPIANPGVAALEAVANPSRTKELYFVADGTGGHAFAETLDQHAKNVARWRQIEKDEQAKSPTVDVDHAPAAALPTTSGPPPASPVRGDQRGDARTIGDPVFGALPTSFGSPNSALQAVTRAAPRAGGVSNPTAQNSTAAGKGVTSKTIAAKAASGRVPPSANSFANFSMGPNLDQLGIAIRGVNAPAGNAPDLDGPIDSANSDSATNAAAANINSETIPLKPAMLADERAREAKYGLGVTSNVLPPDVLQNQPARVTAPASPVVSAQPQSQSASVDPPRHAPVYDASEGTKFDPLLNKTWDLNSPKTVPPLTAPPLKP